MPTLKDLQGKEAPAAEEVDRDSVARANSDMDDDSDQESDSSDQKDTTNSESKLQLAKKETIAVFRLRLMVFVVLLMASVAVSLVVWFISHTAEKNDYKTQFEGATKIIQKTFVDIAESGFSALSSVAVAIIAHGQDHVTQAWPEVTLSSFQQRASTARKQSGALYLQINPQVQDSQRADWENFTVNSPDASWIDQGIQYQNNVGLGFIQKAKAPRKRHDRHVAPWPIWYYDANNEQKVDDTGGPYFPTWQTSPVVYDGDECNENILANKDGFNSGANITFHSDSIAISQLIMAPPGDMHSQTPSTALIALLMAIKAGDKDLQHTYEGDPVGKVYFPIYNSFDKNRYPVAILLAWIRWADYFQEILPSTLKGIILVIQDSCGGQYSYKIEGEEVFPLGKGDFHDKNFDGMKRTIDFTQVENIADGTEFGLPLNQKFCPISMDIYPSSEFYNLFTTATPIIMTCAIFGIFIFTAFMFVCYDRLVERRQALVMEKAIQTNNIVASLFPANVRDRLMQQATNDANDNKGDSFLAPNRRLKGYLDGGDEEIMSDTPIADLFPHCTVLFADISGFTAWSSTRDPAQVFILLQTVYQAFDKIAKRRKVFKVETIGDSYVAVTGLPEPQPKHAAIMARFAGECRLKMSEVTRRLETTLGPDTGDLSMRFGLHSGPVTAGVLRGDRARFQLFGDTVNTAARMESTGTRNKIQISQSTYQLLVEDGKSGWVKPRAEEVTAKGKGVMKTYWLDTGGSSVSGDAQDNSGSQLSNGAAKSVPSKKTSRATDLKKERLVDWIIDMFHEHIRKVVAMRKTKLAPSDLKYTPTEGKTSLDEVAEVIYLPRFCEKSFAEADDYRRVQIDPQVLKEMREFVSIIASHYHDNPFHNFEHACHVTMATNKFLKRIVSPDIAVEQAKTCDIASQLHNYTHGINSDPLTLLGIVFSALIHDVDHRGISNLQLGTEQPEMAEKYKNKSIAEQNSLDMAWELLMADQFKTMRKCLFTTEVELKRFRQVLVNVVLATDIFDPELNGLRKNRWDKAFSDGALSDEENTDLRATIVIEHIIQASDVSHTMQHWHIYRKWNKRLFKELYVAFCAGRMGKDPSDFWYNGELGFFDNYVIPLAKKLKDCNVFGVSSDECLNYALQNREEWKERGQLIVQEMIEEFAVRGHSGSEEDDGAEDAA